MSLTAEERLSELEAQVSLLMEYASRIEDASRVASLYDQNILAVTDMVNNIETRMSVIERSLSVILDRLSLLGG